MAFFVVLALIAAGVWLALKLPSHKTAGSTGAAQAKSAQALQKEAEQQAYQGRTRESFSTYDQAAEKAASNDEKAAIYTSEMNAAMNAGKYDIVISTGQKLVETKKSVMAYGQIAAAYEKQGDIQKAVEYYRKAIDYFNATGPHTSNSGVNYYKDRIAALQGGAS